MLEESEMKLVLTDKYFGDSVLGSHTITLVLIDDEGGQYKLDTNVVIECDIDRSKFFKQEYV